MKTRSLKGAVGFYLQSRRRLGFALEKEGRLLQNLVEYARKLGHRGPLTRDRALDWAQVPPPDKPLQRARRWVAVRHFALFWAAFDPRTQIPPAGWFGSAYGHRRPVHIYTPQQISALLVAAAQLPPPGNPRTFGALLGLLACTGLRISEALQLQLADWDARQAVLTIRQSKFGQSRYVPLSPSASRALSAYLEARAKAFGKCRSSALFLDAQAKPLAYGQVGHTFAALRDQLGWQEQRPLRRIQRIARAHRERQAARRNGGASRKAGQRERARREDHAGEAGPVKTSETPAILKTVPLACEQKAT